MKKLRIKVFFVIFSLLTVFTSIVFISGIVKDYMERKNSISEILTRIPKTFENLDKRNRPGEFVPSRSTPDYDSRRIYLDFTIYTIILDDNGNYKELINNTNNDELEEKYIKEIANNIINNHSKDLYIGNLYESKYA